MASQQSAKYPYQWADGTWHSKPQGPTRNISQSGWGGAYGSGQDQKTFAANTPAGLAAAGKPQPNASVNAAAPAPVDPNAELAKLAGGRSLDIARGESAYQTGNLNFDYGYNPDGTVNTANPYSRAALLQLGFENQQRATTNNMAAAGQLRSGAYGNQQGIDQRNYAQGEAENRLAYQRGLHGIQTGLLGAMAANPLNASNSDFSTLIKNVYGG